MASPLNAECTQRMNEFRRAHPEFSSLDRDGFTLTLDGWEVFLQSFPDCKPAASGGSTTPGNTTPPSTPTPTNPNPGPKTCAEKVEEFRAANPAFSVQDPTGRPWLTLSQNGWQAFYQTYPECIPPERPRPRPPFRTPGFRPFIPTSPFGTRLVYLPSYGPAPRPETQPAPGPFPSPPETYSLPLGIVSQPPLTPEPIATASGDGSLWKLGAVALLAGIIVYSFKSS